MATYRYLDFATAGFKMESTFRWFRRLEWRTVGPDGKWAGWFRHHPEAAWRLVYRKDHEILTLSDLQVVTTYPTELREALVLMRDQVTEKQFVLLVPTSASCRAGKCPTNEQIKSVRIWDEDGHEITRQELPDDRSKEVVIDAIITASQDRSFAVVAAMLRQYRGGHGGGRGNGHYNRDCGLGFEELKAERPFCREYSNGNTVNVRVLIRKDGTDGVVLEPVLGKKEEETTGFSPSIILSADEFFNSVSGSVIVIRKGVGITVPHRKDGSMGRKALAALGVKE